MLCRAALVLGIQYLTFQAFPIVFERGHGFSMQQTGMTFIGMGVGLLIGLAVMPLFHEYATCIQPPLTLILFQWSLTGTNADSHFRMALTLRRSYA